MGTFPTNCGRILLDNQCALNNATVQLMNTMSYFFVLAVVMLYSSSMLGLYDG